jgi:LysR family glycine cleavage system transcriptional activator
MSRRSLPLNAIDAFLVTARHLNLTHAAAELCLTQGAVSRKIASLRRGLAFRFLNATRAGCASPQGSALLPNCSPLSSTADRGRPGPQPANRDPAEGPTCAMRWLVPRLLEVEREHPDLQIALTTTTDHNVNFKTESYDAAIVFGTHMSAGDLLFEEALTPVISPVRAGAALGSLTFLHPTRDKTDWSLWLTKQEGPGFAMHKNQHFDTMDLAITAAIQGLGVAIADETLVAEDVRAEG